MAKPLSLPNVSRDTIAAQAFELFGSQARVAQAAVEHAEVRRRVAERGVDPGLLADVLKEAMADPGDRADRERVLSQYVTALRVPTMKLEVGFGDLLDEEPPEETQAEHEDRVTDEGFWSHLLHRSREACQYPADSEDEADWHAGWDEAYAAVQAGTDGAAL